MADIRMSYYPLLFREDDEILPRNHLQKRLDRLTMHLMDDHLVALHQLAGDATGSHLKMIDAVERLVQAATPQPEGSVTIPADAWLTFSDALAGVFDATPIADE
jgi:hypothetical protein